MHPEHSHGQKKLQLHNLRGKGPGKKLLQQKLDIYIYTSTGIYLALGQQNLHSIAYQLFSGVAVL